VSLGILFNSENTIGSASGLTAAVFGSAKIEFALAPMSGITAVQYGQPTTETQLSLVSIVTQVLAGLTVTEFVILPQSGITIIAYGTALLEMELFLASELTQAMFGQPTLEYEIVPFGIVTQSDFGSPLIEQHFNLVFEDNTFSYNFTSLALLDITDLGLTEWPKIFAEINRLRPLAALLQFPVAFPDLQYEAQYLDGMVLRELVHSGKFDGATSTFEDTRLKVIEFSNYLTLKEIGLHIQMGRTLTILGNDFGLFAIAVVRK
jgi:hypothetical protein